MTDERNPVDQLVELLVYAPIGLLYERDDVLPRLVTRGRSQVQLARVLGQLAVRQGQHAVEERVGEVLAPAGGGLARIITDLGSLVGLAPRSTDGDAAPDQAPTAVPTGADDDEHGGPEVADTIDAPLPIAGYDQLPARTIIPLLADLSRRQRQVVRQHEETHRRRKTVLGQLDLLDNVGN